MSDLGEFEELIAYLARTSRLSPAEAQRIVGEVLSFLQETPEEYVRRRHRVLQAEGLTNTSIYMRLRQELSAWRFRAPQYTPRQIRRMIYG
jgi:DNA-directed RNA polymerase subunit F